MTLVALTNALLGDRMVERFHAEPRVQATEMLLQERVPRDVAPIEPRPLDEMRVAAPARRRARCAAYRSPHTDSPHTQFLSNGHYVTSVTNAGGGASVWRGLAGDAVAPRRHTRRGRSVHLSARRAQRRGVVGDLSALLDGSPTSTPSLFSADRASFRRRDDEISTQLDIAVSTEDDVEVRRITVRNHGARIREIDVTSYAEIVLTSAVERSRPSGVRQNLRRNRVSGRQRRAALSSPAPRCRGCRRLGVPCVEPGGPFAGSGRMGNGSRAVSGPRPEPGAARSRSTDARFRAPPASSSIRLSACVSGSGFLPARPVRLCFATGMAPDRETVEALARKYHTPSAPARTFALAMTHAESGLRHLGISADDAMLFERLASRVLGTDGSLRARAETIESNELGQAGLWPHAISGDLPILLVRVVGNDDMSLVRQVLQAQEYWRLKGMSADVVIVNEHPVSYLDEMQAQLTAVLEDGPWSTWQHRPGGAYLLRSDSLGRAERVLLEAVARAVLCGDEGDLRAQLDRPDALQAAASAARAGRQLPSAAMPGPPVCRSTMFDNGVGGFTDGGRDLHSCARRRGRNADAMEQRHRKRRVRHHRHFVGGGAHVGREQP